MNLELSPVERTSLANALALHIAQYHKWIEEEEENAEGCRYTINEGKSLILDFYRETLAMSEATIRQYQAEVVTLSGLLARLRA